MGAGTWPANTVAGGVPGWGAGHQMGRDGVSALEAALALHIRAHRLPEPVWEYRFGAEAAGGAGKGLRARLAAAGLKDWRFDFAYPDLMLAIECEGGIHSNGRHVRG